MSILIDKGQNDTHINVNGKDYYYKNDDPLAWFHEINNESILYCFDSIEEATTFVEMQNKQKPERNKTMSDLTEGDIKNMINWWVWPACIIGLMILIVLLIEHLF